MKSIFKIILIFSLSTFSMSCEEDEDKTFQTNLSLEANQLFEISTAWGESLYLGVLNFEDFSQIPSPDLPGCPSVFIEMAEKKVTLTFDPAITCEQSGEVKRTGKLILQYPLLNTNSSPWTLTYQDYTFQNDTLRGTREFSEIDSNQVEERFVNLRAKSNQGLNTTFSGTLYHSLTKLQTKLIGLSSSGSISGTNSAGRAFFMNIINPKQTLISCFSENEILPIAGRESWTVDRGQGRVVTHSVTYESFGGCAETAKITLSDGRTLLVIP